MGPVARREEFDGPHGGRQLGPDQRTSQPDPPYSRSSEDLATGKYCDASSSMSMGAASYSQWQVESSSNLVGGILDIPAFNFWFTSNIAEGFPYNLVNYVVPSNHVPGVSLGAETYNAGACAGNH